VKMTMNYINWMNIKNIYFEYIYFTKNNNLNKNARIASSCVFG